jgi:hypothetical protein
VNAWISVAVMAGAQVLSQLIWVVGAIWQERARATSVAMLMEAAAIGGTTVCERYSDGSARLIAPSAETWQRALAAELISGPFAEKAPL